MVMDEEYDEDADPAELGPIQVAMPKSIVELHYVRITNFLSDEDA